MAWHGYVLLSVNPALADTWDEGKRAKVARGVRALISEIKRDGGDWPPYILQVRWALNQRSVIIEGNFDATSKTELVKKIAAELGVTQTQVNNNLTVTVFGGGKTWAESRAACEAYLQSNRATWEDDNV